MKIALICASEKDFEPLKEMEIKSFEINRKYFSNGIIPGLFENDSDFNIFKHLQNKKFKIYKILIDDKIAGSLVFNILSEKTAMIELFFLLPEYQDRGNGQIVFKFMEQSFTNIKQWVGILPIQVTKNLYFYLNKCNFKISRVFNKEGIDYFYLEKNS